MRYPLCRLAAKVAVWLIGLGFLSFMAFGIWKLFEPEGPLLTPDWYNFNGTLKEVVNAVLPQEWGWWGDLLSVNGLLPRQWVWWINLLFIACILAIIAAIAAWPYRKAGKKRGSG